MNDSLYDNESCVFCGGVLVHLGQLGERHHLRCRMCGLQHSVLEPEGHDPQEEEEHEE